MGFRGLHLPFSVQGSTEFVYLITRKVRWGLISREIYNRTHIFFTSTGACNLGGGGERGEWEDLEVAVYGISDVHIFVFWCTRSSK